MAGTASRTALPSEANSPPFVAGRSRLHLTKSGGKGSPHVRYDRGRRPPPPLGPFHRARPPPDPRRRLERLLVLCRLAGRIGRRRLARAGGQIRPHL